MQILGNQISYVTNDTILTIDPARRGGGNFGRGALGSRLDPVATSTSN